MRSVSGARNLILSQIINRSLVIAFLGMTNENPRPTSHRQGTPTTGRGRKARLVIPNPPEGGEESGLIP